MASLLGGRLIRGNPRTPVRHTVYGGTRYLRDGVVLILHPKQNVQRQLKGLYEKKSAGVIVPQGWQHRIPSSHAVITVPDTNQAMWTLVRWQRAKSKAIFIGITGSAGKTTTKEMTAVIAAQRYRTLKSYANNNLASLLHYHLLRLTPRHQVAVLEMGMASLGNIRKQCLYAKPSIGVVTNVGEAHVGSLGSSLANVVRAKQEMVDGVQPGGTLILNVDDPGTRKLNTRRFRGRILTFGIKHPATVRGSHIQYTKAGMTFRVGGALYQIPTWGHHNVYNALAAITIGRQLGVSVPAIQQALRTFPVPKMRLQRLRGRRQWLLINDAYNANPTSMEAGLGVLRRVAGKGHSVAVLGDMHELGKFTQKGHRDVGRVAANLRPSLLITVGPQAAQIAKAAVTAGYPANQTRSFANHPAKIAAFIYKNVPAGSTLYFKASRKVELERVVKRLR
ncbi:UDP-N-acetylmuramoyl-tripeptide--D-alanyl-D-alanine ligase [Salinithrix halophila]|uniref:UDP-N-acetylmuramoyl-tripeptide--D-alanyl-D-alanine ligase n=2 Tax=Salinithrix halophila TaxID=1485204 RepID=A0ABV8JG60_9BACL